MVSIHKPVVCQGCQNCSCPDAWLLTLPVVCQGFEHCVRPARWATGLCFCQCNSLVQWLLHNGRHLQVRSFISGAHHCICLQPSSSATAWWTRVSSLTWCCKPSWGFGTRSASAGRRRWGLSCGAIAAPGCCWTSSRLPPLTWWPCFSAARRCRSSRSGWGLMVAAGQGMLNSSLLQSVCNACLPDQQSHAIWAARDSFHHLCRCWGLVMQR